MESAEAHLRPLLREHESLQSQAMLELERRKDELANLVHQIENDLGAVEMETSEAISTLPPGLEQDIRRLKTQIKDIGPVNPNAPSEYEEVLERYDFLTTQAGDLEEAATDLRLVIGELDELMERDFSETFEVVRREFKTISGRCSAGVRLTWSLRSLML